MDICECFVSAGALVLVWLTVLTPLMYYIPVCAMAATIMMGGIDVVTFHKFGVVWTTKRKDVMTPIARPTVVSLYLSYLLVNLLIGKKTNIYT